jgi:hydrogenase maturation protease
VDTADFPIFDENDILILGIGNYLMGDEGVGVHFIKNLDESSFPPRISFIDGGTGGFALIPFIENHQTVILVDATRDGKTPGSITLLKPKFSNDFPISLSGHNFGLKDMVDIMSLQGKLPEIYLFTISIEKIEPMKIGLSPEIENAIGELTPKIIKLVGEIREKQTREID